MKITINKSKKGVTLKTDAPATFDQVMELLFTSALATMNDFSEKAPETHRQQLKEAIYDNFNEAASATLSQFMPDKELRPDLTEEAIKRMEDAIMEEEIQKYHELAADTIAIEKTSDFLDSLEKEE